MATIVNIEEAESSLCRLVKQALAGDEVILTRNDLHLVNSFLYHGNPKPEKLAAFPDAVGAKLDGARSFLCL